ncbi:hypothetical protein SBA2_900018 [Acidobacteriia bacterium SbA2]|nr:hypothetical protein SBA2_900018 [Acidobacteriia bacterium SbA2]
MFRRLTNAIPPASSSARHLISDEANEKGGVQPLCSASEQGAGLKEPWHGDQCVGGSPLASPGCHGEPR